MTQTINHWNAQAIILAAGKATRFKTKKTKLLFNICGRLMVMYPLHVLNELSIPSTLVLGYQAEEIWKEVQASGLPDITYVIQEHQRGTGDAVKCSQSTWTADNIVIINGDCPLLTKEIIHLLLAKHMENNAVISFGTTMVLDPEGYGRIIEKNGKIKIIEEKNCTEEQRNINRINAGIYIVSRTFLENNIGKIEADPLTNEIYFIDLVNMASEDGLPINAVQVPYDNVRGVNTLQDLWAVEQIKRSEFIKYWMSEGVRFELAQSIHIDIDVEIGAGSFIGTGVHLVGKTKIGEECFVGAFSILENTCVGDNTTVYSHSVLQDSSIGKNVEIGPFARLREQVQIGDNGSIGNFVEIKSTSVGDNTKMKHLTYIGNAEIGASVNIGAGTIFCNYDGINKHKTIIKDRAFIGSNNTLIAPITIGEGAYTAGGSTLKNDVPSNSLAIARAKQEIKPDYAKKLLSQAQCKEKELIKKKGCNFKAALKTTVEQNEL